MEKVKRPKIGIGYQVGRLTVKEPTDQRKSGYTVWRCQCACGNEMLLDTRSLQRGAIRDCGCVSVVGPGQRDISGMRFGKLIAVAPVGVNKDENVVWHCKCDCGGEVDAPLPQLRSGYRKSCGCLSRPPLEKLEGKRFHQLTVQEYAGKKNGAHYWKCRCDCGNMTTVRQDFLKSGKTKSCGCLAGEQLKDSLKLVAGTSVTLLESVQKKRRSNNVSGVTGVYWNSRRNRWCAQITFRRKTYSLGSYQAKSEAIKARKSGERLHDDFITWYYSNYGMPEQEAQTPPEGSGANDIDNICQKEKLEVFR